MGEKNDGIALLPSVVMELARTLSLEHGRPDPSHLPPSGSRYTKGTINMLGYALLAMGGMTFLMTYLKYFRD